MMQPPKEPVEFRANRLPWPPILDLATAGLAYALERLAPSPGFPASSTLRPIGLLLLGFCLVVIVWAIAALLSLRTTVSPTGRAQWLVERGPFRWSRNPMYLATLIGFAGAALLFNSLWTLLLVMPLAIGLDRLAIVPEERHLMARFGTSYAAYCKRVRRWL